MQAPRIYMAAPVPRSIRQSRFGHLPTKCIIGTRTSKGDKGSLINVDIVMLPVMEFQRMKMGVSLQHAAAPSLQMGGGMQPSFVLKEIRQVSVPPEEPDPEAWAKNHFLREFGLTEQSI